MGGGKKQKEEKGSRRKGRLVTSGMLTLQAVSGGWGRGEGQKEGKGGRRKGRLVTLRAFTLQAV